MQTEKAKSSHFDRTRGDKNQIFPTKDTLAANESALVLHICENCADGIVAIDSHFGHGVVM